MSEVTAGKPKELLKLGRKTVLQRVIEEAREAGADQVVVVNSPDKPEIDEFVHEQPGVLVAYQNQPHGLTDAVAGAGLEEDCFVLLGDVVFQGGSPLERMGNLVFRGIDGCIAVEQVTDEKVSLYGIVEIDETSGGIRRILEKPQPSETGSRWAIAARFAFSGRFMSFLSDYRSTTSERDAKGEINLTQALNEAIEQGMDLKAVALQDGQQRVDCGSASEYDAARRLEWD
jgi:UTP--glucose-1-phosphate uridylyltransferase